MITIYDSLDHHRIGSSKNLRGILSHGRKNGVNVIRVRPETSLRDTFGVTFYFHGHTEALTEWADWRVLLHWLAPKRAMLPDRLTLPEAFYREAFAAGLLKPLQALGVVVTHA